jgi:hypothetical protein
MIERLSRHSLFSVRGPPPRGRSVLQKKLIACIEENGLVTCVDGSSADYYAHEKVAAAKHPR